MERAIKLLTELKAAIDNIPNGIAAGRRDGLLVKNLTPNIPMTTPPITIFPLDEKDGDYAAFSNQWERVFQLKSSTDLTESKYPLVCCGKHGLILAHAWATHYLTLDSATADDIDMMLPPGRSLSPSYSCCDYFFLLCSGSAMLALPSQQPNQLFSIILDGFEVMGTFREAI
ncbi:hypothetical protein B0H14DRAFT_3437023 [Mycena olivaceomarginata]|nr:hypothetical protein B0H14DRAFT_3437023 [Mycena olivaceomarginata]